MGRATGREQTAPIGNEFTKAEVSQFELVSGIEQDVLRLNISVHYSLRVSVVQGIYQGSEVLLSQLFWHLSKGLRI